MENEKEVLASIGLDELVESRLRELITSISRGGSAQDIEPELTSLAKLIDEYSRKDELLENLLDPVTTIAERQQIRDALNLLEQERVKLEQLHTKARDLLQRSIQSLLLAKKQIYERHNGPEYSPELWVTVKAYRSVTFLPVQPAQAIGLYSYINRLSRVRGAMETARRTNTTDLRSTGTCALFVGAKAGRLPVEIKHHLKD